MNTKELQLRLTALRQACASRGVTGWAGKTEACIELAEPATAADVERVERQLGQRLPPSLRSFFLNTTGRITVGWFLPDDVTPPPPFNQIFCGTMIVDLSELVSLKAQHQGWVEACFKNPEDPYDSVWHHKLPILHIANGDLIGIEMREGSERVCYLSHDGSDRNGFVLGDTFTDYLDRLSQLGFVGPEDWQWEAFVSDQQRVDPRGAIAQSWRDWFGLRLPAGEA